MLAGRIQKKISLNGLKLMDAIINATKNQISSSTVRIVSFDLFDTLVCRPVLYTKDMLRLFSRRISMDYQIDIERDRLQAPIVLDDPFLSLPEIWAYIAHKKALSSTLAEELAEKEFEFDLTYITPKAAGKILFDYARSAGKQIVVISDMYYSSAQLRKILEKCGYSDVSIILVSCEQKAVKRTGALFRIMLNLTPSVPIHHHLHIGDSVRADYSPAVLLGMQAAHIPSNRDMIINQYGGKKILSLFGDSLYESFIYGTAINFLCSGTNIVFSLEFFAHMLLYPMLLHIGLFLLNNRDIQRCSTYQSLYFASRDGFLMKQAYDALRQLFPDSLPSEYLLTSRAACSILQENDCWERLDAAFLPADTTLSDYISASIADESLKQCLRSKLAPVHLTQLVKGQGQMYKEILSDYSESLQADFGVKKGATQKYYSSKIGNARRVLLVDCGFNGTIASMLTEGFHGICKFDKVYLWSNKQNIANDSSLGTRTFPVFTKKKGHCLAPMAEAFFSECSGSCIGFTEGTSGEIIPIYEYAWIPLSMLADINAAQSIALMNVNEVCSFFADIVPLLGASSLDSIMDLIQLYFTDCDTASTIFKNIRFKETYSHHLSEESLASMMIRKSEIS